MIWFSQRSRIVFCSFHAIFCPLCINIFWIFCSMSHIQGFECCSDRTGDISATVPFLARVPSRCSRDLHPYALSSVITSLWGTECILLSPTTLSPIVCFPCLLLYRDSLQYWGCRGTFEGLMYTSQPQNCFEHSIERVCLVDGLCLVHSFIVRPFSFA